MDAKELEAARQDALDNLGDGLRGMLEEFGPGSFGYHEALHTASIMVDNVDRFLCSHPSIVRDAFLYEKAYRAFTALYELYQALGDDR